MKKLGGRLVKVTGLVLGLAPLASHAQSLSGSAMDVATPLVNAANTGTSMFNVVAGIVIAGIVIGFLRQRMRGK